MGLCTVPPMDALALRDLYDRQLRAEAELADCAEVTRIGPLLAGTFPQRHKGFVTYASLGAPDRPALDALIDEVVAHFAADPRVTRFEWKTRDHDAPADLREVLVAHGFVLEETETVMVGEAERVLAADPGLPEGYLLRRADTADVIRAAEGLAGEVFGDTPAESAAIAQELVDRLAAEPEAFEMWAVHGPDGAPVCSGRIEFVAGTDFAGLWGGACHVDHRGRGLYRVLTAARARVALAHGKRFLQSDCTAYSRPILERAGLVAVTTTTPAMWHR